MTPQFELYCVAGPQSNRNALAQGAGKIVQWARREEERIFILGGAVSVSSHSQQFFCGARERVELMGLESRYSRHRARRCVIDSPELVSSRTARTV